MKRVGLASRKKTFKAPTLELNFSYVDVFLCMY